MYYTIPTWAYLPKRIEHFLRTRFFGFDGFIAGSSAENECHIRIQWAKIRRLQK